MKKEDYEAWKTMPLTKEYFELVGKRLEMENREYVRGKTPNVTKEDVLYHYYTTIAINRFFEELQEASYEDLVTGIGEYSGTENSEENNDRTN